MTHGLQYARLPCLLVCSNSYPLSQWCYPAVSSSDTPFSCPHFFLSIRAFSNDSALRTRWLQYCLAKITYMGWPMWICCQIFFENIVKIKICCVFSFYVILKFNSILLGKCNCNKNYKPQLIVNASSCKNRSLCS